jgi:phosphoglycerate dehydrogenase-like enzyme
MSLIIASQFDEDFNAALRAHPSSPIVIAAPEADPWSAANEADILLVRPTPNWHQRIGSDVPEAWPGRVKWVFSGSVGIDRYPSWLLEGPQVTCSRGVYSNEIAHYVISAIYTHSKDLEAVRARSPEEWAAKKPLGQVAGSTIGILGLGDIGSAVARLGLGLGAKVVAARRRAIASPVEGVELLDSAADVVAAADHLLISVPATASTHKLVDADLLARAKPTAHLINIARGSVVDQEALIAALDAGRLAFATLDVTDPEPLPAGHPLWTHPRVRLTPHISTNYAASRQTHLDKILTNYDRFVRGETPADLVDPAAGY